MYTVYVIRSKEGLIYKGQTSDIKKRLIEHNSGKSLWTKRGKDWRLIYSELYNTRGEAMKREKYFKTGKGRDFIKKIIKNTGQ